MHLAAFLVSALGLAVRVTGDDDTEYINQGGNPQWPVAQIQTWVIECGYKSGHTAGTRLLYRAYDKVCLPLPDNTRGIDVQALAKDCPSMFLQTSSTSAWLTTSQPRQPKPTQAPFVTTTPGMDRLVIGRGASGRVKPRCGLTMSTTPSQPKISLLACDSLPPEGIWVW